MKNTKHASLRTLSSRLSMASVILACLVVALASAADIRGSDSAKKPEPKAGKAKISSKAVKTPPPAKSGTSKTVVTGTRIPQDVKNRGRANATSSAVHVVNREAIERSGAMTMADLLRRLPFVR